MLELRPYQLDMVAKAREEMQKGHRSVCLTAPTGSGKTALAVHMLHTASNKGMTSWFVCHRREILNQTAKAFRLEGLSHGVISVGFPEDKRRRVQIASIQTLLRRYRRFMAPKLIVVDECHHIAAKSWAALFANYPKTFFIGLSATPERTDGQGLGKFFSSLVLGPTTAWLIENKFLSPYRLYAPSTVNVSNVHMRAGDFAKDELVKVVDKPSITGDAVAHYRRYCNGKKAVVFCVSIEHSRHVAEKFKACGISAAHVDGETDSSSRDRAITDFKAGNIQVLSNVDLFGEGFDTPGIEAIILLRPTQSLGLYLQQIGRGLRIAPGKIEATILDHVGACVTHGLPDEDRMWSLQGRDKAGRSEKGESKSVKVCPKCYACTFAGPTQCKFCGCIFDAKPREVDQKEGELTEVDKEAIRRQRLKEQGGAESLEDLYRIGVQRKYRHARAWAHHVFQARQARKLGRF